MAHHDRPLHVHCWWPKAISTSPPQFVCKKNIQGNIGNIRNILRSNTTVICTAPNQIRPSQKVRARAFLGPKWSQWYLCQARKAFPALGISLPKTCAMAKAVCHDDGRVFLVFIILDLSMGWVVSSGSHVFLFCSAKRVVTRHWNSGSVSYPSSNPPSQEFDQLYGSYPWHVFPLVASREPWYSF